MRLVVIALIGMLGTAHADDAPPKARTFAGSIQLDYLAVPTEDRGRVLTFDGATVELSLKHAVDLSEHTSASVKVCFACHGFEAGMAFVELRAADELHVRVGRMTPAFGAFPARHDPANHLTSDKPLPYDMGRMVRYTDWNEGVLPAPWVDNGIEVGGTRFFEYGRLDYAVWAMSGPKANADGNDFDFVQSRSGDLYYVDNNSQPAAGARVSGAMELLGHGTLELGASAMGGHYDPNAKLWFWIGGVDVAVDLEDVVKLRGEYLYRRTDVAMADHFDKQGFYVEGDVPIGRVDLLARFDGLHRSGDLPAGSMLAATSTLLRYTAAVAVKVDTIRIKSSVELYDFTEFDRELAVHLGLATPF